MTENKTIENKTIDEETLDKEITKEEIPDENTAAENEPESTSPTRVPLPRLAKIALIVVGSIIGILIIAIIVVNVFVRTTYADFYNQAEDEFPIPGIDSGFIPQDIDYYDLGETWLYSGYMADGSPSPIFKQYVDGTITKIFVKDPDGNIYDGHGSAITSNDNFIYLTCENGYLVFNAFDFISLGAGQAANAVKKVGLDFSPAFMNIENDELYLGNFYHPEAYETPDEHHIDTPDGSLNQAIMYVYGSNSQFQYGFSNTPVRAYSIPDRVQGVCVTPNEKLIFSTSYGLASSHILVYDTQGMKPDDYFTTSTGDVPLFILDSRTQIEDLEAPPMTEGIETHKDRIYICDESATNKYIFGKLYGAGRVLSIPVPGVDS